MNSIFVKLAESTKIYNQNCKEPLFMNLPDFPGGSEPLSFPSLKTKTATKPRFGCFGVV